MNKIKQHGDFKEWWCETTKQNVWTLGYFGGSAHINLSKAFEVGKLFAEEVGVDINSISAGEISHSQRYKYFKYITSGEKNQKPTENAYTVDNVWDWLYD